MKSALKDLSSKELINPFSKVSLTDLVFVIKRLALMLHSGLDIVESLRISHEAANGKLKNILGKVSQSVTAGNTLSAAFANHPEAFSPMIINSLKAGEQSGNLPESLDTIAEQLNKERLLKSKIRDAMLYPTIVMIASSILGAGMAFFILPKITPLLESLRVELPLSTKILIAVANAFRNYSILLSVSFVASLVLIWWLSRQPFIKPFTHKIALKVPALGKMTYYANLARFCRNLGTLLRSGVNIDRAIEITAKTVDNYYFQTAIEDISHSSSTKLSENLAYHPNVFPGLVMHMVSVGEESGNLDETLLYLADYFDEEVDGIARSLPSILEPLVLLIIGVVVAFLALSIMTPIFKATGGLGQR